MKNYFLILLLLVMTIFVHGQQKNSFISLHLGPSIPVGSFNATNNTDDGFALTGMGFELDGAWFFLHWLGVGASGNLNLHPVDAGKLGDYKLSQSSFLTDLIIRSDPYLAMSFYSGLYFEYPLANKLSLTA